ncbi:hypothetical protein MMC28_000339 [Mycoblastus sanguinarius]|nr:hypothetical protein [Mycoblastus sanguinarius]
MAGSKFPIAVSHAEGRAYFPTEVSQAEAAKKLTADGLVSLRYVDNYLHPTETYPGNPNGSPAGLAGLRSEDGSVLARMPHPERCVLNAPWTPQGKQREWSDSRPWLRIFQSARRWVG